MTESMIEYRNRIISLSTEELWKELQRQKDTEKIKFVSSVYDRRLAQEQTERVHAKQRVRDKEIADEYKQTVDRWYKQGVRKYKGVYRYEGEELFQFSPYPESVDTFIERVRKADEKLKGLLV